MRVFAPFKPEIVEAVNKYQQSATFPYTCGCKGGQSKLIALKDGLVCEQGHVARNFVDLPDPS